MICTAMLFRRFNFELYGVDRQRDVDVKGDFYLAQPGPNSQGIKVKVHSRTT